MNKSAVTLHAPDQVKILKQRIWQAAADRLVNAKSNENARISVAQAKPSKIWIDQRHLPGGVVFTLKDEREVTASHRVVPQRGKDRFQRSGFRSGIGMDKPQYRPVCFKSGGSNLATAASFTGHNAYAKAGRDFHRAVFATSIGDDNFLITGQRLKGLQCRGDLGLFIQRRHNDAYHGIVEGNMIRPLLILFAKAPVAGRVKTRLCPPLRPEQASSLHSALVRDTIEMLLTLADVADLELSADPSANAWPGVSLPQSVQSEGDLGTRLFDALESALTSGRQVAMVLGSDSPGLPPSHVTALLKSEADVTLGPTVDGGFFAIMCRKVNPMMFEGVRWSTGHTLDDVVRSVSQCGLTIATGPSWFDVDVEDDLARMLEMTDLPDHTATWAREYQGKKLDSPR